MKNLFATVVVFAILGFAAGASVMAEGGAEGGLSALKGAWQGKGTIYLADNKSERLRCKVYYTGKKANELRQAVLCASPSYRVELRAKLQQNGKLLKGTWEERSFGAEGKATGKINGNGLTLDVKGAGFTGKMTVNMTEENQSVEIETDGIGLKKVTMTLSRF